MSSPVERPEPRAILDLSRNEGDRPGDDVLARLMHRVPDLLRDYLEPHALEADLADMIGVTPDRVVVTTGGDDGLDRVFRAFVRPGAVVAFPVPTFEMIPAFARMAGADIREVSYEWGALPLDELGAAAEQGAALIAVISPDNPTGVAAPTADLVNLARRLPSETTFLVDQAYVEFGDEDPSSALLEFPNVVLVRTLSKAWGLAGLRIGYAVSTPDRIRAMREVGGPYPVSSLGLELARERLAVGGARMRAFVAETEARRDRLTELVRAIGGDPIPSQTNFVTARFEDPSWVARGLAALGIRVRAFPHLPEHLRITAPRTDEELVRLEAACRTLVRPEALIFDMDGVLADVRESYRSAIVETCSAFGVDLEAGAIARAKARGNANDDWVLTRDLLAEAGVDVPLSRVTERFEQLYQGTEDGPGFHSRESPILSRAALEGAASLFALGIVTGRPRRDAERFLRDHGLSDLFGTVICREDAPLKPSPEPVEAALAGLGVQSAWFFGDTPDDVRAARGASVVPVGVIPPGGGDLEREALMEAGAATSVDAASALARALGTMEMVS